ncbi:MAG: hypothetical protein OEV42_11255 [Deltaproteobacteria bacterium]|nr:hypothetical protein [Deltaproteobacteria bacterium]
MKTSQWTATPITRQANREIMVGKCQTQSNALMKRPTMWTDTKITKP